MGPAAAVPAGLAPSRLGYSIGRLEDDGRSPVVETTALNWPYYDTIRTPLSPDVKITEHFTLSDDQSGLTYRQTVVDSATLTGGARVAAPGACGEHRAVCLCGGALLLNLNVLAE
jgi:hypothetical protein